MANRPGGLTALAVLNFVFAGLGILGVLALAALMTAGSAIVAGAQKAADAMAEQGGEAAVAAAAASSAMGQVSAIGWLVVILSIINIVLLFISGVGFLKQSKGKGQKVAMIYGIFGIATTILNLVIFSTGFGFSAIIGLIYPVLLIVLPMTVFKDAFVNP